MVTWQGYVNNFGSNIKVQRFDARGDVLGPLFNWRGDELGSYLNDSTPQICALTDGGYVVVWYGATADDQQRDVFVQRVGADHVLKGGVERLHGSAGGDDVEVQVAALVGGGYVVVWQGDTLNQGADIFVQQFGSTNQKAGSVQQLHGVAGLYDDLIPHVCAMADGGFTVTWQGRVDGQSDEIFTQRFGEMGITPTAITVDTAAEVATVSGLRGFDQVVTKIVGAARNVAGYALDVVGVSEKFASVTLSIGGESKTVDADGSGQWHYALTQDDLDHVGVGDETITVTNTVDLAGNQTSTQTALDVVFRTTAHTANNREDGYAKGTYVDSLIEGGGGWSGKEISYSFNPNGYAPWTDSEKSSFKAALQAYANVCNLKFTELSYDANIENQTNWVLTKRDTAYWSASTGTVLGSFEFPTYQWEEWGAFAGDFNAEFRSWNDLSPGGLGFNVLVHELGHALDLAHPFHGTPTFPGVDFSASDSYGTYGLNDSVWTVMSYSNGWQYADMTQDWRSSTPTMAYGTTKTPMLFDIAALQTLYGVNTSYMAGDDTYVLPTSEVAGTGWSCLWDAGGRDTISNAGSALACVINLNAYPLTAGVESQAYVSRVLKSENVNLCGGFTIADGAVVENAIGGNGADALTGNAIANVLTGNGGADQFVFDASLGAGNVDTISDFNLSQADKLVLSKSVFKSFGSSATVSAAQFRSGPAVTQAADTNDYLIYNSSNGALYYDADGSSGAYLPIQFASLTGAPHLNANYFVLAA